MKKEIDNKKLDKEILKDLIDKIDKKKIVFQKSYELLEKQLEEK